MTTATFRFYARLNAFLSRERRGQAFSCPCAQRATTKHMIEALGVPHTEVALVLADGNPVGLDWQIGEGERIAVYPALAQLDVGSLVRLPPMPTPPRFVADAHLGGLARLLRMAGFDTLYDNHYGDAAMVDLANREHRVLLTRDRALLMHRAVVHGCYVQALKPAEQLRELYTRLQLAAHAHPFSLCLGCNEPLRTLDRQDVIDRVPERVWQRQSRFLGCERCHKVFWEGSHWQDMRALLEAMQRADA
ncbi:Mut7-C RNAse domain-containing protein [Pseudomonas sp.]|uniref:Mut7-C RNAse domain-containing protein n=1 Tax=Pseudomonas sp. TaxID=306 RepID=UPI0028AA87EC|nr:Mut7-C RNAse domain-containing protein [Pseudomonas sp.]